MFDLNNLEVFFLKDKVSIGVMAGVVVLVAVTVFIFGAYASLGLEDYALFAAIVVILGLTVKVMWQRTRDVRKGIPPEDELSKRAGWKAGYHAYLSTVWVAVGMMWLNIFLTEMFGFPEMKTSYFVGAMILIPGIIFLALALRFRSKGNVE